MFPVLAQVDSSTHDALFRRQPATPSCCGVGVCPALRQLFTALASQVILVVDDLHWADADSVALLDELLRGLTPLLSRSSVSAARGRFKPFLQALLGGVESEARVSVSLHRSVILKRSLIESLGVHTSSGSTNWVRMTREAEAIRYF
jgi:predicted ATPase